MARKPGALATPAPWLVGPVPSVGRSFVVIDLCLPPNRLLWLRWPLSLLLRPPNGPVQRRPLLPPPLFPLWLQSAPRGSLLSHISLRVPWAGIFSQELKATCSSPCDPAKWSRLIILSKCILSPTVSSRRDWRVTLHLVWERLRLWSLLSYGICCVGGGWQD